MAETDDRLRRLIADEVGECRARDVEARLEALRALDRRVPPDVGADVRALSALGSETRYRIVRLLLAAEGEGELCVCELTPLVDVSGSAISHALAELADAGLVERRKEGKWRYYRPTERAARLVGALDAGGEG